MVHTTPISLGDFFGPRKLRSPPFGEWRSPFYFHYGVKPRKNGGFLTFTKNPRWKNRIDPCRDMTDCFRFRRFRDPKKKKNWRIWCMIIPVGTGDFTSPKSSKLMVYQKSTIVTTCLFWQLKKCWKSHPKENSSLRFLEPFQLCDFSDVKNHQRHNKES